MNYDFNNIDSEQWKYTSINQFKKFEFECIDNSPTIASPKYDITVSNNNFSSSKNLNENIAIYSLSESIKNNNCNIKDIIKNEKNDYRNPFIDLNNSNNGVLIHIKHNSNINSPIKIKFNCGKNLENKFINNKIFILIDEDVEATIFFNEQFNEICYLNSLLRIFIKKNSTLNFIHHSQKLYSTQIFNFLCSIQENSILNLFPIDIKGKLIKKNYYISLMDKNSTCNYDSLNLLSSSNHIDNYILINHIKNNTYSSVNQKSILLEKSKSIFYAKAIIQKNSSNSEVEQNNNNLLLSDTAKVHSNPQLEIYNNDVKCAHGSTTGALNDEILFYMRSRGLKKSDCKKIILYGFTNQIIDKINNNNIKNAINEKVGEWLKNVN